MFSLVATFVLPRGRSILQRPPNELLACVREAFVFASETRRRFAQKDALLAMAGPVALLVQLVMFLLLLLIAFALMLAPWTHSFGLALAEAGSALSTIGFARVAGRTNEVLAVLAAASGAVTIALQIGYLPALYQSYERRETLVALLESRSGIPAWGPEILLRHQLVGATDTLAMLYRDWELWAADVAESHSTHPVLLLFRSPEADYSWLLALLAVLDAAALQLALMPSKAPSEARMCLRMGFSALRRLASTLGWTVNSDPLPDAPIELTFEEFNAAVEQLNAIGFVLERSAEEAWPHFHGWRVNYEAIAYRLADVFVAPHAPWSGPRRHLPTELVPPNRPPHRNPDGGIFEYEFFRPGGPPEVVTYDTYRSGQEEPG
jgi:hypothetical protein